MITVQKIVAACVFTAATITAPMAMAHAKLTASNPAPGAVLEAAPTEIALTFNEKVEQAFSTVTLIYTDGKVVATDKAKVDVANPAIVRVRTKGLSAGTYTVKWAVAGHDGHRRTGTFSFSVK
ncbi:copper homeostasis periplasmic binding protein CopC [Massilia sp. CMS3.1]|uniref:copper homeostasis periplasmic binding protein CopC n=1 Tax=Massilia sp. CMS3.1 TaxID=3373083 RepID=UPI003EE5249C